MRLSIAISASALIGHANGQCPSELIGVESITPALTMYYSLVLSDSEPSILCARIESESESWLGWGINPSGKMIDGEAIIGLPDQGTVRKFMLNDESMDGVVEMDEGAQTLMETSIVQENGMTIMSFAKYLEEDQYGIFASGGVNSFIYAIGSSNALGFHAEEGNFFLEFPEVTTLTSSTMASVATSSIAVATMENTPSPTTTIGNETEIAATPSPTITLIAATPSPTITSNHTVTTNPTIGSTESSTSDSTDAITSTSTSNFTEIATEAIDGGKNSTDGTPAEVGIEANAPRETSDGSVLSSYHGIGGLSLCAAALALCL